MEIKPHANPPYEHKNFTASNLKGDWLHFRHPQSKSPDWIFLSLQETTHNVGKGPQNNNKTPARFKFNTI